jgi:hypothetical protein
MSANLHTLSWISECNLISDLSVANGQGASLTCALRVSYCYWKVKWEIVYRWREQITFWCHGENKLLFDIMARTNYFLLSWQEQITFCYHGKNKLLFDIMARTNYFLISWQEQITFWWYLFCTGPTRWVGFS